MRPGNNASPDLNLFLSLSSREERDRQGFYFVEGLRFAFCALEANVPIRAYAWCPELLQKRQISDLLARFHDVPSVRLSKSEFERLEFAPEPQGLALVLRQSRLDLARVRLKNFETWLGMESIRHPGNLGTILRALKAAGGAGVILFSNRGSSLDIYDPRLLRASMGAAIGMRVVHTTYNELRRWSYRSEIRVLGADTDGALDLWKTKLRRNTLMMIGDERNGLSPGQRSACEGFVRIPMSAGMDSLNVAMASTVLLYEACRQKRAN